MSGPIILKQVGPTGEDGTFTLKMKDAYLDTGIFMTCPVVIVEFKHKGKWRRKFRISRKKKKWYKNVVGIKLLPSYYNGQ